MHSEDIQEPISTRGGENHSQLSRELADWHVRTRTPQSHTDDLLRILRKYHGELPLTARTLLQTDRSKTTLSVVEPGFYHHFGIQNGILDTFVLNDLGNTSTNAICLLFVGVDGIALVKSSSSQFWAVVGYLPCFPKSKPFVIGVYHGYTKPQSSNSFLKELVEEAQALYHEGFQYNGELIRVVIGAFICDAPARAMIACVKSHSSTNFGCARCTGFGANIGFLRSNISFREGCHPTHHNSKSILEMLPYLDMVRDLPLDPMHLLYLGVMRKILYYLIGRGNRRYPKITLSVGVVKRIDSFLIKLRNYISRLDFARKPRSTGEFPRWKATELREFLHYIGVVVFKQYLSVEYYTHFLLLHVAVKLLSQDNITVDDRQYADELLNCFVTNCESFYGKSFVTYNVHSLLHLVDDVSRFGALDRFSAFRFENFYGHMKHYLKKNDLPLQQYVRRKNEEKNNLLIEKASPISDLRVLSGEHFEGPEVPGCVGRQYRTLEMGDRYKILRYKPDNCIYLRDKSVVLVKNFMRANTGKDIVIGKIFSRKTNFFVSPCDSSLIDVYLVCSLSDSLKAWDINDILCKAVLLPSSDSIFEKSYVVFPLL